MTDQNIVDAEAEAIKGTYCAEIGDIRVCRVGFHQATPERLKEHFENFTDGEAPAYALLVAGPGIDEDRFSLEVQFQDAKRDEEALVDVTLTTKQLALLHEAIGSLLRLQRTLAAPG